MDKSPISITTPVRHELTSDVEDWLCRMTPKECEGSARYAVTLTLDIERMHRMSRSGYVSNEAAVAFAKATFSTFRRALDRKILKTAATRYGRELDYVPVIEGQGSGHRIHYHCVIVTPSRVTLPDMTTAVKHAWSRTDFGHQQIDVQPMLDDGWLAYMSKEAWTLKRDAVDIENVRLSTSPLRC